MNTFRKLILGISILSLVYALLIFNYFASVKSNWPNILYLLPPLACAGLIGLLLTYWLKYTEKNKFTTAFVTAGTFIGLILYFFAWKSDACESLVYLINNFPPLMIAVAIVSVMAAFFAAAYLSKFKMKIATPLFGSFILAVVFGYALGFLLLIFGTICG
jgi:hypothetical protein